MENERFDGLIRNLGAGTTRRGALGLLAGLGLREAAAKDRRGAKGKQDRKGKARKKPRDPAPVSTEAAACTSPGPNSNLSRCTFNNRDFAGIDLSSSSMVGTRFRGTDLCGADLSSSQLKDADFRGFAPSQGTGRPTNLTLADLSSSGCHGARFNNRTVFCRTRTCNGAIRDDDCPAGVDPADICCADADCTAPASCIGNRCCDVCANGCAYTSLEAAVADPQGPTTIRICPGAYRTVNVLIDKDVAIVGAGAGETTLDAERAGRVLQIAPGADVEIRDVRITGGVADGGTIPTIGGGIQNSGALTLLGVLVTSNPQGGGISNSGTLVLEAGTFVMGNTTRGAGGGIANEGVLTLRANSHVDNNTQTAGASVGGGGIWTIGTLTMEPGSTVSDNTAATLGGGIRVTVGAATLQAGSRVTGNKASLGGGIQAASGTMVALQADDIVTDNTPENCHAFGANPIANCVN